MYTTHLHDPNDLRYSFYVVWFDALASLNREYTLLYYTVDNTIEMIDRKTKKTFLKRTSYPEVQLNHLFVGSTIVIYGRQLQIKDFGDDFTREALTLQKERAFCLIRPEAYLNTGNIITTLNDNQMVVTQLKSIFLSPEEARALFDCTSFLPDQDSSQPSSSASSSFASSNPYSSSYKPTAAKSNPLQSQTVLSPSSRDFKTYCDNACDGMCIAVEVVGPSGISLLNKLAGPAQYTAARTTAPSSLIAKYGRSNVEPGLYVSPTLEKSLFDSQLIFDEPHTSTAQLHDCTAALVFPHAINENKLGPIVQTILDSATFTISAIQMFQLNKTTATEFFEVYDTVIPEFPHIVNEACNGSCVAMEIVPAPTTSSSHKAIEDPDIVMAFRDFVGPHDPAVAKTLRPKSLRALFGTNRIRNAVHCTDLSEDGTLESEYFFSILQE